MTMALRRRGEQHVELVDRADAGVDDADLDLVVAQLLQRVGEHFRRALHVGLDDDRQVLHAAFGNLLLERLEREAAALGAERLVLRLLLAERARSGAPWPGRRRPGTCRRAAAGRSRPSTSTGVDGPACLIGVPAIVDERADLADHRAGDEVVADAERAVLHEDRRHRAAAAIELGLEHGAHRAFASGSPSARGCPTTSRIISSSRSRFWRFFAETSTVTVVPPHASGIRPRSPARA